jgi:hypothetical protein
VESPFHRDSQRDPYRRTSLQASLPPYGKRPSRCDLTYRCTSGSPAARTWEIVCYCNFQIGAPRTSGALTADRPAGRCCGPPRRGAGTWGAQGVRVAGTGFAIHVCYTRLLSIGNRGESAPGARLAQEGAPGSRIFRTEFEQSVFGISKYSNGPGARALLVSKRAPTSTDKKSRFH